MNIVDQIERAKREIASWPRWMQDAARQASATLEPSMNRYQHTQAAADRHGDNIMRAAEQLEHEDRLDACETWDRAQSIAHDPARLDELQADGPLDYSKVFVKIDGQQRDLFEAADLLRLRVMAGRHAEADCVARDMTDALATEVEALIRAGRV